MKIVYLKNPDDHLLYQDESLKLLFYRPFLIDVNQWGNVGPTLVLYNDYYVVDVEYGNCNCS